VLGAERRVAVCRELTKLYEEVRRGTATELVAWAEAGVRGEIVIVVEGARSEEHTSELQSREKLVCRLLLEKKNGARKQDLANELYPSSRSRFRSLSNPQLISFRLPNYVTAVSTPHSSSSPISLNAVT